MLAAHTNINPHAEQPLGGGCRFGPRRTAGKDGIGKEDELSGAGHEGQLVRFACFAKAGVEGLAGSIPLEGRWQSGGIETGAQARSSASNGALTNALAAIVVEWGKPGKRCRLAA